MKLNGHNDYIDWLIEWVWSVGGCGLLPGEHKRCTSHRKPFRWLPHAPAGEGGRERGRERGRDGTCMYYTIFLILAGLHFLISQIRSNCLLVRADTINKQSVPYIHVLYKYEEQLWVVQRIMSNT